MERSTQEDVYRLLLLSRRDESVLEQFVAGAPLQIGFYGTTFLNSRPKTVDSLKVVQNERANLANSARDFSGNLDIRLLLASFDGSHDQ